MPVRVTLTALLLLALRAAAQPLEQAVRLDLHGDSLPPGAVARLGTIRLRPVAAAEFTSDGKAIVTSANVGLRLWDAASGKLLARTDVPLTSLRLAVTRDGRCVAVEGRDGVILWAPRTGQRMAMPLDGGDQLLITALAFSPDGGRLAVATLERRTDRMSIRILPLPDGSERHRITDHKVSVSHLVFTTDHSLLSIDQNYTACLHDVATGILKKEWLLAAVAADGGEGIRHTPNGRWLVQVPRTGQPSVWEAANGERRCVLDGLTGVVRGVDVSADGHRLAALILNADGTVHLGVWDVASGRRLQLLGMPGARVLRSPTPFRISPDGRTVAVFGEGYTALRLWEVGTGQPAPLPDGHAGTVSDNAVTADGRWVVTTDASEVRGWDLASSLPRWITEPGFPYGVAMLPDDQTVVVGRSDSGLEFRELATGRLIRREKPSEPYEWATTFTVTADGSAALFLRNRAFPMTEKVLEARPLEPANGADRRLSLGDMPGGLFTPDGRWLVSALGSERTLTMISTTTGRPRKALSNVTVARPDAVSHDSRLIAIDRNAQVFVDRGPAQIVDVLSLQSVVTLAGLSGRLPRARFSPDDRTLAVITPDRAIALFDTATGRERLRLGGFEAEAAALFFTPDHSRLLSGHSDGTILVWDVAAATRRASAPAATEAQLDGWWADLAGEDASRAYRAVCGLSDVPGQAVPLFRARLKSTDVPAERIRQLLADLDSPRYPLREAASRQLTELGDVAEPALRHALATSESLEQRLRLQDLVDGLGEVRSPEVRRLMRAVWVLERAGTPDSVRTLEEMARGPSDSRLTVEARDAVARLRRLTPKVD